MANAFQMLLIISAFHSNKLFVNVKLMVALSDMDASEMEKFEYCVKILIICYCTHDNPADYNVDDTDDRYDYYLRKNGCIKEDLTGQDNATFWKYVREWQHDVEEIMLDLNILSISEVFDHGNSIKIDLTLYFHIPKVVICDRKKMFEKTTSSIITTTKTTTITTTLTTTTSTTTTTTTTTEPTTTEIIEHGPQCNESDPKGKWIMEQTELGRKLPTLVSRLPNVMVKLNVLLNRNCCPYPIIRDRVEIINDIVDLLIQLFCVPYTERAKSTGYALLDIENLMTRLGQLNLHAPQNNRFNCSCCSDWEVAVKGVTERFRKTLISIVPDYVSIISIFNSLSGNQNNLVKNSKIAEDNLSAIARIIDNNNNEVKCCNITYSNVSLIDKIEFNNFNNVSSQQLHETLMTFNVFIENTQNAIHNVESKITKFIAFCEGKRLENEQKKLQMNFTKTKVNQLEEKIKNFAFNVQNSLDKAGKVELQLHESVDKGQQNVEIFKARLKSLLNEAHQRQIEAQEKRSTFNLMKRNALTACLKNINEISNLKPLSLVLNQSSVSFINWQQKLTISQEIVSDKSKKLRNKLNEKLEEWESSGKFQYNSSANKQFTIVIYAMQSELTELYNNIIGVSGLQDAESKKISSLLVKMEDMLAKEWSNMEQNDVLDAKIKKFTEQILYDFEKKINASSMGALNELYSKLEYLETNFSDIKSKTTFMENDMLKKVINIQYIFKELNEKLIHADIGVNKCLSDCDWGDMPSLDSLEARIEALEEKLNI